MRKISLVFLAVIFVIGGILEASAIISYPSNNFRLDDQPTYCIVTSDIPNSQAEDLQDMAKVGVIAWKNKLQAAELNNKLLWDMKYKLVDSGFTKGCDITIYFKPTVEQVSDPGITTIGVFYHYTKSIEIAFKNVNAGKIYNIIIHEIGHSLGLGHFVSDDDEINLKWWSGDSISPSIMIPITHRNPSLMKITDEDVLKTRAIYGSKGFFAFSTEPLPVPIPTPTPTPIPPPTPIQPIIPIFPFESIGITHEIIEVGRYGEQQIVKIIGDIKEDVFHRGIPVYLVVKHPDESFQTLKILTTKEAHFETTLIFDSDSARGTYKVEASYLEHHDREMDFTFRVVEKGTVTKSIISKFDEAPTPLDEFERKMQSKVPEWIKNNAKWWAEGQIEDSDFVGGIQYMIKEKIVNMPDLPEQASATAEEHVPDWIKNNAKWWADGLISEDDFVSGIKWLVENGVIKV